MNWRIYPVTSSFCLEDLLNEAVKGDGTFIAVVMVETTTSTNYPTSLKMLKVKFSVYLVVKGFFIEEYVRATGVDAGIGDAISNEIVFPLTVHDVDAV